MFVMCCVLLFIYIVSVSFVLGSMWYGVFVWCLVCVGVYVRGVLYAVYCGCVVLVWRV